MPHQVGGHPSGASGNAPPASTPGSTPSKCGSGMRASPKDPLKNVTNYRSSRWRKDLEHVLKAYYKHNYAPFKEAEWNGLRDKFFKHLLQHQEEFKSIKENQPLEYMPYMARHFHAITGLMLGGLSHFMGWIKPDSYYHALVAQKGQLNKCPHLVEVGSPRRPQVTPSESRQDPVCLTKRLAWLKGPAPMYLFPWRQVEWGMAGPGQTGLRAELMMNLGVIGLQKQTNTSLPTQG